MFYFGLRSSHPYLASLDNVHADGGRVAMTSVVGGFAFLHALHPEVSALTLVDCDPDALVHWRLMARLIDCAESLEDFVFLLSGGHTPAEAVTAAPIAFMPRRDPRPRLYRVLSQELHALYQRTYGAMAIDETSGHGHIPPASTVMFTGFDLTPMHFCWHFGQRNLRDNASFRALQATLRRVPVTLICGAFETLDYAQLASGAARHVFLASNCEAPLFTHQDVIFEQVMRTTTCPVRYVSWVRDGWVDPRERASNREAIDVARLPLEQARLLSLPGAVLPDPVRTRMAGVPSLDGPDDSRLRDDYCHELLVLAGGEHAAVMSLLVEIAPNFRRVLWVSPDGTGAEAPDAVGTRYAHAPTTVRGAAYFELRALRSGLLA